MAKAKHSYHSVTGWAAPKGDNILVASSILGQELDKLGPQSLIGSKQKGLTILRVQYLTFESCAVRILQGLQSAVIAFTMVFLLTQSVAAQNLSSSVAAAADNCLEHVEGKSPTLNALQRNEFKFAKNSRKKLLTATRIGGGSEVKVEAYGGWSVMCYVKVRPVERNGPGADASLKALMAWQKTTGYQLQRLVQGGMDLLGPNGRVSISMTSSRFRGRTGADYSFLKLAR